MSFSITSSSPVLSDVGPYGFDEEFLDADAGNKRPLSFLSHPEDEVFPVASGMSASEDLHRDTKIVKLDPECTSTYHPLFDHCFDSSYICLYLSIDTSEPKPINNRVCITAKPNINKWASVGLKIGIFSPSYIYHAL
jgi:hypothetical protein